MQITRFRHLTEVYGADIARWPVGEHAPAAALLARSPEARRLIAEAAQVDEWLALADDDVTDDRIDRVASAIDTRIADTGPVPSSALPLPVPPLPVPSPRISPRSLWPAIGFLAAMGVLGVIAGNRHASPLAPGSTDATDFSTSNTYQIAWGR